MPLAIRRAFPNVLLLTSACTSTSIGREPSMQHSTADPGLPIDRSARNNCEGFGTSRSPVLGHLEDAELARGAEPFLNARTTRCA